MKPTLAQIKSIWPRASDALVRGIVETWDEAVEIADLTTPNRLAHFFGQMSEESAGGSNLTENLNYSASRMVEVWPRRFNLATAAAYAGRPQALANKVYNGRMGNRTGSDDGWNFRGRGLKQITGRDMYEKYGIASNPDKACDPKFALILAAKIWRDKRCNDAADRDSARDVTLKINGGTTNLANRVAWTNKWKRVFTPVPSSTLRLGDQGPKVRLAQTRLAELNYQPGEVDDSFGSETQKAVLDFQARNELRTTGEIDLRTADVLYSEDAAPRTVAESRANATVAELREAGSTTIATADQVKVAGTGLALFGGTTQAVEGAKGLLDETSVVREVITTAQDVGSWAMSYWWVWLILLGFLIWRYGHLLQKIRLRSHQTGQDVSR